MTDFARYMKFLHDIPDNTFFSWYVSEKCLQSWRRQWWPSCTSSTSTPDTSVSWKRLTWRILLTMRWASLSWWVSENCLMMMLRICGLGVKGVTHLYSKSVGFSSCGLWTQIFTNKLCKQIWGSLSSWAFSGTLFTRTHPKYCMKCYPKLVIFQHHFLKGFIPFIPVYQRLHFLVQNDRRYICMFSVIEVLQNKLVALITCVRTVNSLSLRYQETRCQTWSRYWTVEPPSVIVK